MTERPIPAPAIDSQRAEITVSHVASRVREVLPASQIDHIRTLVGGDVFEVDRQIGELAQHAFDFYTGAQQMATIDETVRPGVRLFADQRVEVAQRNLLGILAYTILPERHRVTQKKISEAGLHHKVAQQVNILAMGLGETGREEIVSALENLNVAERTVLLGAMSTHLKNTLEYPDADNCSTEQMTAYLHDAIYGRNGLREEDDGPKATFSPEEMITRVEKLIDVCHERSFGDTSVTDAFRGLLKEPYSHVTIQRIIEVADITNQLDVLEDLLQQAGIHRYAKLCREIIDGDREGEEPVWLREKDKNR